MKKLLLSMSIGTMLAVSPAQAQLAVIDNSNLIAQAKNLLQELKSYATQLQQLEQEIQQVTWLATTAQSMIQNPNLGSVMALMGQLGLTNDLPINPNAVMGLISGYGGISSGNLGALTGALSSLNGLVNTSWTTDHVYTCTTNTFACQQQQQLASSTAGLKGTMGTLYQDLANHIQILQGLRASAGTATDPAQRENILEQVALENAWAQNTGNQLQASVGMFTAQRQANVDRENEHLTQDIEAVIAAAPGS